LGNLFGQTLIGRCQESAVIGCRPRQPISLQSLKINRQPQESIHCRSLTGDDDLVSGIDDTHFNHTRDPVTQVLNLCKRQTKHDTHTAWGVGRMYAAISV
jgi:hypothetical protein